MGGRGGSGRSIVAQGPAAPNATATAPSQLPLDRPDIAANIMSTFDRMMNETETRTLVGINQMREALPQYTRTEFDTALRQLFRRREIGLIPASNQKVLTSEQRQAGVLLGGEWKIYAQR